MELLHFKKNLMKNGKTIFVEPFFKCCDMMPDFVDVISSTDFSEMVIKSCKKCGQKFKEETIFGKQSSGYPHISTFSLEKK